MNHGYQWIPWSKLGWWSCAVLGAWLSIHLYPFIGLTISINIPCVMMLRWLCPHTQTMFWRWQRMQMSHLECTAENRHKSRFEREHCREFEDQVPPTVWICVLSLKNSHNRAIAILQDRWYVGDIAFAAVRCSLHFTCFSGFAFGRNPIQAPVSTKLQFPPNAAMFLGCWTSQHVNPGLHVWEAVSGLSCESSVGRLLTFYRSLGSSVSHVVVEFSSSEWNHEKSIWSHDDIAIG